MSQLLIEQFLNLRFLFSGIKMATPAGYDDDDDYDYDGDYYDENDDDSYVVKPETDNTLSSGPWDHPRCLSPIPSSGQSQRSPIKDDFAFLDLIRTNNVVEVRAFHSPTSNFHNNSL